MADLARVARRLADRALVRPLLAADARHAVRRRAAGVARGLVSRAPSARVPSVGRAAHVALALLVRQHVPRAAAAASTGRAAGRAIGVARVVPCSEVGWAKTREQQIGLAGQIDLL